MQNVVKLPVFYFRSVFFSPVPGFLKTSRGSPEILITWFVHWSHPGKRHKGKQAKAMWIKRSRNDSKIVGNLRRGRKLMDRGSVEWGTLDERERGAFFLCFALKTEVQGQVLIRRIYHELVPPQLYVDVIGRNKPGRCPWGDSKKGKFFFLPGFCWRRVFKTFKVAINYSR